MQRNGQARHDRVPRPEHDPQKAIGGEVRFDAASRATWSADASNYRGVPIGVIAPDAGDVEAAMAVCRAHDVPVLPVGSRTRSPGRRSTLRSRSTSRTAHGRDPVGGPDARTATVQPGRCDAVRDAGKPHGSRSV
ncbi:FAD-binding oxidoreductase [Pseudonocardia sp. MCCB 268]|nr:FAD-binding oxidoreductase [Pseudonocardia cytotoxica]